MNANTLIFGLASIGIVAASIKAPNLPLVGNPKIAMAILIALGMAMCTPGIGKVAGASAWSHPVSILGMITGVLILVIAGTTWLGKSLPFLPTAQAAMVAILALEVVKMILTRVHPGIR